MDARTLGEVMGWSLSLADYERLLPGMENAMIAAHINTPDRAAMWCAQIGHESNGLHAMEEYASGAAYEWRADLGNIYAGDGVRYKGSGPIQLTGRNNFRAFTRWCRNNGYSTIDFEAAPHLVREVPKWGFLAATYFWDSRPQLNRYADQKDLLRASAIINGWYDDGTGQNRPRKANGWNDRLRRYNKAVSMGERLLPGNGDHMSTAVRLDYPRDQVVQDTYYNCGPASAQTIIRARTGVLLHEVDLGVELRTHAGGTDWIGQFPAVLNKHLSGAGYRSVEMPNDPPNEEQKDALWGHIKNSVDAGYGVVANIVAPPNNYPRAVSPSTISPEYSGGTVYHYVAVMGYDSKNPDGIRSVWVADSGFYPFGYWMSFEQLATLIPPKGYAYSTATPVQRTAANNIAEGLFMSLPKERQEDLANKIDRIYHELVHEFPSRYEDNGVPSNFRDTLVGYGLENDRKVEDIHVNMLPEIYRILLSIQKRTSDRKGK